MNITKLSLCFAATMAATLSLDASAYRWRHTAEEIQNQQNAIPTAISDTRYTVDMPFITEPKGECVVYDEKTEGFVLYQGNPLENISTHPANIWIDGSDAYFQSPIPSARLYTFIKGTVTDEGIDVVLPQYLGAIPDKYGNPHHYFVNVIQLDIEETSRPGGGYDVWYQNVVEQTTVKYIKGEDGSYTLEIPGNYIDETVDLHKYMLGITHDLDEASDYSWSCYADYYEKYRPFVGSSVILPDNLTTEKWAIISNGEGRLLDVAIDGNDFYAANWTNDMPDAFVKGTIKDGVVTFPRTFLGIAEQYNEFEWFAPAEWGSYTNPNTGEIIEDHFVAEEIQFDFDTEKKVLENIYNKAAIFIIPSYEPGELIPAYFEYFPEPQIVWQNPETINGNPQNPTFISFADYRDYLGYDVIEFDLPCFNEYGNMLNTNSMYYVFYISGEPMIFMTDEYFGIDEDMEEIPYNFTDRFYEIYSYGRNHQIAIYAEEYDSVGVQLFYIGTDGDIYKSDLVQISLAELKGENGDNAVDHIACDEGTVTYTTLSGLKVMAPEKGVYLKTTTLPDGAHRVEKILKK